MTTSTLAKSSVESSSSDSSGASVVVPLPATTGTVLAGFTPTVASITEQNSLEILESSFDNDHARETPPRRLAKPTSTVPDVVYDEYGQTWDVYGAEFDPAILGQAIQAHLEKIMERKARVVAASDEQRRPSFERMTVEEAGSKEESGCLSGRDGSRLRQRNRAVSFVLRYLCASLWRPGRTAR